MKKLFTAFAILISCVSFAAELKGIVTDTKNTALSHSSILIKGTSKGTTANEKGFYSINLNKGNYTIICQHIGYKTIEKKIEITNENIVVNFVLDEQQYNLQDVVVKSGSEDPAYEIIRNAIKTREEHLYEIKKFETEVYVKGQIQLRNYPKKFLGETVDFEDGDTSKKKMIFLSESIAKYSVDGKENRKIEVQSTRVSGVSDGFGMASPQIISFYNNIINVGRGLNPRGFISPIANNALHYYTYKFMGTFYENGKEISRIKITPKRSYEPLFNGYINIIENEWRIHSTDVTLLKEQQLQILDTLNVQQIFVQHNNQWIIKQQVLHLAGKFFSFDFFGNIVQVYDKFNTNPIFSTFFFDNTILKFTDSSNKKIKAYWDTIRPIPLLDAEAKDYKKKDSLEQVRKDPKYLDSIDKRNNKPNFTKLFLTGYSYNIEKNKSRFTIKPLLTSVQYNTVEGLVADLHINYFKDYGKNKKISIEPNLRYGFSNHHFNPSINTYFNFSTKHWSYINLNMGSNVFQFDNQNPIDALDNTIGTLFWMKNYMKTYQAKFATIGYGKALGNGFSFVIKANYQNRTPLENTTNYAFKKYDDRVFTDNHPANFANIIPHKAFATTIELTWKPGTKYIEFPDRRISIGSKYPTFNVAFTQGINNVLGSNVDYSKWQFTVSDNLNLKLGGRINYNIKAAGFSNATQVYLPDVNHILGNQISTASEYLNSFQLMPYYLYSNSAKLYFQSHLEYHLNGLLSNKIPVFKKLNWFFVIGGNAFYNNDTKQGYYEAMFSVENILKVFRIDFVKAFPSSNTESNFGVKFSVPMFGKKR